MSTQEERITQLALEAGLTYPLRLKFKAYIAAALSGGVDVYALIREVKRMDREDAELAVGRCPNCGRPIKRYGAEEVRMLMGSAGFLVGLQVETTGEWISYRCSSQASIGTVSPPEACRYMLDRFEPIESS